MPRWNTHAAVWQNDWKCIFSSIQVSKLRNLHKTTSVFRERDHASWNMYKGVQCFFTKVSFPFHLKNHHALQSCKFTFGLKRSSCLDVRSNSVICSCLYLIMVTIIRYIFTNSFQNRICFSHTILHMLYALSCVTKISKES